MADQLQFDILARDKASGSFRAAAAGAADLADKLDIAAISSKAASEALGKVGKASDLTATQSAALARVLKLTGSEEDKLAAKSLLASAAVKRLDDSMAEAGVAAEASSGAGIGGPGGLAVLAGAAVALSPVVVTLATGLAGFAAAAYSTVSPVLKAAQATGGLKANLDTLTGPQQAVAKGFLGLEGDFSRFGKALQPQVFSVLNSGLGIAKTLLTDVAPVARATGTALDQVAASVAGGLKSAEWKQFFAFMAANAGPDTLLVAKAFGQVADALPPILEALQPVGRELLTITAEAAQTAGGIAKLFNELDRFKVSAGSAGKTQSALSQAWHNAVSFLIPETTAAGALRSALDKSAAAAPKTGSAFKAMGNDAATSATQVTDLYNALHKLLDPLTQNIQDAVTFKTDQVGLASALKKSHDALGLHTVATRASATAAAQAAQDALTLSQSIFTQTGSASKAIGPLQSLETQLKAAGDKSAYARGLIKELAAAIAALHSKTINVNTIVTTSTGAVLNPPGGGHPLQAKASGGPASGWTIVGEKGWELLKLPSGSQVISHAASAAILSGRSGGSQPALVQPRSSGGGRIELVVRAGSDTAYSNFLAAEIRKYVQVKGGGDVQVTYGRSL